MSRIKPPVCGQGEQRCPAFVAPGYNPLRLCRECLAKYRAITRSDVVVGDEGPTIDLGHRGANR